MPIKPSEPRHTVERLPDGVRVVLPSEKKVLKTFWYGLMIPYSLVFVGVIVFVFGRTLIFSWKSFSDSSDFVWALLIPAIFFIIFLTFTLVISGFAVYSFLWQINGREIIEIKKKLSLSVTRQVFRWKPTDEYILKEVKDLRAVDQSKSIFKHQQVFWQKIKRKSGSIAFDYGAKTFHFGEDIDEAEAKQMIAVLQEYLPV